MRATRLELRDFRNYERAEAELSPSLTVVSGPNGAGKTNLLEAICFVCTGRSPRTTNERELVRRGAGAARVVLEAADEQGEHRLELGFEPGGPKRLRVDGRAVEGPAGAAERPLVAVFMPERLELVKGAPGARRGHLDRVVAALWPGRADGRPAYSRALAQRNALLGRIRAGAATPSALDAWDRELAQAGVRLMSDRAQAVAELAPRFARRGRELGLPGEPALRYLPRSRAADSDELAAELRERRAADLERAFTAHGPHRDELQLELDGAPLRTYGSQGQQRIALLALLLAERDALTAARGREPLLLLDDVMSELDAARRELLAELLRAGGQAIVTATEPEHVPGAGEPGAQLLAVLAATVRAVGDAAPQPA